MDGIFSKSFSVPASAIDANGHVNNIAYVQWMQDVAIEHSTSTGWTMERFIEEGFTWVARSHFVEYLRPAFEGEPLTVHTWIAGMEERRCPRHYLFLRDSDGKVLARAETLWVCVNMKSGRPITIPPSMVAAFPHLLSDAQATALLGIPQLKS